METAASSNSSALPNPNIPTVPPVNSAAFKRENRRKRKERKRQEKLQLLLEDWAPLAGLPRPAAPIAITTSDTDWPLEPVTDENPEPTAWNLNLRSPSPAQPPASAEALAQANALRLCREFFAAECGSDDEDWEVDDRNDGKSYNFFKGLFHKEADLRDFYLRDWAKGEFYCLACEGIGEKLGKKFVGLAAVSQHATFISKTKRIMVHRSYGRVVCELLGWEIHGLRVVHSDDNDEEALKAAMENTEEDGVYLMDAVEMNVDIP
ncbi:uncharacterized protein LOC110109093 [Dendrobium catenatum]|uniref:uncharacterized protein LOC110109093 n=1 Tax=Dendrobium catenatum TaxID=906689 RepID=UPI0009F3F190|nr:uncharacterized protein LOC110109093 [Dendrobium catenatum]